MGVGNEAGSGTKYLNESIDGWESINFSLMFAVFLPIIIFHSALSINWHRIKRMWLDSALLSIFGTMYNAALITISAKYIFPYNWSWSQAWLFGAILSAIDPVAVVAVMESVGAAERLATVIDAESLLNDGVAFVLFELFADWVAGEDMSAGHIVGFTFKAAVGGPALGLVWGAGTTLVLYLLFDDLWSEIMLTIISSFSLWLIADHILGVSGVLALVFAGGFMAAYGKLRISSGVKVPFASIWTFLNTSAETLVFALSGVIIAVNCWSNYPEYITAGDFGLTFALWGLLLAIRGSMVLFFFPILSRVGYRMDWRDAIVLTWAGLRGTVGLILSIAVINSAEYGPVEYRVLVFFHMGAQSVITLLVQGSTIQTLLTVLGYMKLAPTKRQAMEQAAQAVESIVSREEESANDDQNFGGSKMLGQPDWEKVRALSSVGIDSLVKKRKVHGADELELKDPAKQAEDLRQRFLSILKAIYSDIYCNEYLTPGEYYELNESVEIAEDKVPEVGRLCDWSKIDRHFAKLRHIHKLLSKVPGFKGLAAKWLHSTAVRECVTTVNYIYAHSYARKILASFINEDNGSERSSSWRQNDGVWQLEGGGKFNDHVIRRDVLSHKEEVAENLPPYWQHSVISSILEHGLFHVPKKFGESNEEDVWKAQEKAYEKVLQESREEQLKAQHHLNTVREACPGIDDDTATVKAVISVLKQQIEFVSKLSKAGLLEGKEVGNVQHTLQKKLKWLHWRFGVN